MSVKHGCRGDILLVYVLSIIKGLHTCIHLKNGKIWSTLRAVPIYHEELMSRCDIHLTYFGFGIILRLIKRQHPIPDILGTIYSDNPSVLNKLTLGKQDLHKACPSPLTESKEPTSAAAGSVSDLPRLERELISTTSAPCTPGTMSTEATPNTSVTTGGALSGTTTLSADTTSTALHLPVSTQLPPTLVKQEPTNVRQGNITLHELCVKVKRLTESDIAKHTTRRKTFAKPLKLVSRKLPLVPTQSVNVATPKLHWNQSYTAQPDHVHQ